MRLKSIKLAGFKSFVDPTTVKFPSNLCAVVGPNGCGKSNIIDAVRWVMGESSAKNLRGESMTDVIFAGSSARKPVGQASVELVFDNSERRITGEYAGFNEISVKRVVNSDAQSTYLLNGTKCRRRDITDIFLGTGLGPRSYSIIEQGMVSRLIESRPEDLRIFIEEAAGISKYKERRKETESRIGRTRENLERLTDIREELERQLQHLQRQAKAAEKYRELKEEERGTSAQLKALRWSQLNAMLSGAQEEISELEVELEKNVAELRKVEAEIEQQRESDTIANEGYQKIQAQFYELGSDVTRIEQNIEYQRQRKHQLQEDLVTTEDGLESASRQLTSDLDQLTTVDQELSTLEPQLVNLRDREVGVKNTLSVAEESMKQWQEEWDKFNQDAANTVRKAEVEQQRINHLENIVERGNARKQSLTKELEGLVVSEESTNVQQLESSLSDLSAQQEKMESENTALNIRIDSLRNQLREGNQELNQLRTKLQTLLGQQASLEALQQQALGSKDKERQTWLEQNQLTDRPRLVDGLRAESGWELALETVLGEYLQAICVDDFTILSESLSGFKGGKLTLKQKDTLPSVSQQSNHTLAGRELLRKVQSSVSLGSQLHGIFVAESLAEALELRSELQFGESIVSREGAWVGPDWLRLYHGFDEKAGMLQRQQELEAMQIHVAEIEEAEVNQAMQVDEQQNSLKSIEQQKEILLGELRELNKKLSNVVAQRSAGLMKIEQVTERRKRLRTEIDELQKQIQIENQTISTMRATLQSGLDQMEVDNNLRESLLEKRDVNRRELDEARAAVTALQSEIHELALQQQALKARSNSLEVSLERLRAQVTSGEQRRDFLREQLRTADDPLPGLMTELEQKLSLRQEIENAMAQAKSELDGIEQDLRILEKERQRLQERSEHFREQLADKRLTIEGSNVKRAGLEQELKEDGQDLQTVLSALPEELSISACELQLEQLTARINRLGPINLAAIDEFEVQSQRKVYLDSQNDELERALKTLENAIRKIDKETRTRFKETFDKINNGLQSLFPKVFGGGHAYLDMVGEDLLDTGVAIMARPPGKKNSTIHLLSGGEKAMTAIALVFSIFQLNPSPFCMLDEVDAPLDDANVGRYNELVKEMSSMVQFIFITHNRLTMESANQLLGVTMHEPGVSRLVAVDIDEAAELAAM